MNKKIYALIVFTLLLGFADSCLGASNQSNQLIDSKLYSALQNAQTKEIKELIKSNDYSPYSIAQNLWIPLFMEHQNKNAQWIIDQSTLLLLNGIDSQKGLTKLLCGGHRMLEDNPELAAKLAQIFIENDADINAPIENTPQSTTLFALFAEYCAPHKTTGAMRAIKVVLVRQQKKKIALKEAENTRSKNGSSSCHIQ